MFQVIHGDCQELIGEVIDDKTVIVTDPPFNIGYKYNQYKDSMKESEYLEKLGRILRMAPFVLVHYPETICKVSIELNKAPNRIISWVYNSNTKRQHRDIAWFGIEPDFSKVKQPYKNPNDKRIKKLIENGSKGRDIYDWWEVNQVKNVSKEKTIHPCQMPYEVMDRIIKMLPEGVTVVDPYCGSGTTGVACVRNNVDFIGIEIDELYADITRQRINAVNINA